MYIHICTYRGIWKCMIEGFYDLRRTWSTMFDQDQALSTIIHHGRPLSTTIDPHRSWSTCLAFTAEVDLQDTTFLDTAIMCKCLCVYEYMYDYICTHIWSCAV